MERENVEQLIDLGAVSSETKGADLIVEDSDQGRSLPTGLSDD
jgi:hypothetical protein